MAEQDAAPFRVCMEGLQVHHEFHHPSWYDEGILDLLAGHDASLCLADHHLAPAPWVATASHVYVRGHGPDGRYRDNYPDATLRRWARHIETWQSERRQSKAAEIKPGSVASSARQGRRPKSAFPERIPRNPVKVMLGLSILRATVMRHRHPGQPSPRGA